MKKLSSLTIFFPFYNDEGTVERQIKHAFDVGKRIARSLEVIAIHGGKSKDNTLQKIKKMQERYPTLKCINKIKNKEGYAVIKYGLEQAKNAWVFYTDGDAQYHLEEDLIQLIKKQQKTNADIVNGYKKKRSDSLMRVFLGKVYARLSKIIFGLPIRDTDCDFRLIRKKYLKKIFLESKDSSILPELIKKLQLKGAKFVETPVSHYPRIYGRSNYNIFLLIKEKIVGDFKLFLKMRTYKK